MNVEIGIEAAQFPEKEYINWILVAVCRVNPLATSINKCFIISTQHNIVGSD
jgi:hypothetical protein